MILEPEKIEKNISSFLWVNRIRILGGIVFFTGRLNYEHNFRVVIKDKSLIDEFKKKVNIGDLLKVFGVRQKKDQKEEIALTKFLLINKTKKLPFYPEEEPSITEKTKYLYRYLDLRSPESQKLIILKSRFLFFLREFFFKKGFKEVETPILSQYSPEGSNCFKVVSNFPGRFYTLAQSPQIFKQLLMVGGLGKYFQIAKSFRLEDARSNRQIEFLQLDVEQSFTSVLQIKRLIEKLLTNLLPKLFKYSLDISFVTYSYRSVMHNFNTEKPDIRKNKDKKEELKFVWITDWPLFFYDKEKEKFESFRHPFSQIKKRQIRSFLDGKANINEIKTDSFDLVCNGEEILSGSLRIFERNLQEKVFSVLGYSKEKIEKFFGYFLEALEFAAPPHGGFGLGIDRLLSVILGLKSIKPFLAFPKNVDGVCPLTKTPDFI